MMHEQDRVYARKRTVFDVFTDNVVASAVSEARACNEDALYAINALTTQFDNDGLSADERAAELLGSANKATLQALQSDKPELVAAARIIHKTVEACRRIDPSIDSALHKRAKYLEANLKAEIKRQKDPGVREVWEQGLAALQESHQIIFTTVAKRRIGKTAMSAGSTELDVKPMQVKKINWTTKSAVTAGVTLTAIVAGGASARAADNMPANTPDNGAKTSLIAPYEGNPRDVTAAANITKLVAPSAVVEVVDVTVDALKSRGAQVPPSSQEARPVTGSPVAEVVNLPSKSNTNDSIDNVQQSTPNVRLTTELDNQPANQAAPQDVEVPLGKAEIKQVISRATVDDQTVIDGTDPTKRHEVTASPRVYAPPAKQPLSETPAPTNGKVEAPTKDKTETPANPAPKTPETPATSVPDIIIDPALAGETQWSPTELAFIRDNIDMYTNIEKATGVEWEIMVALHYRETSLGMTNPANGQGLFQLYSSGEHFSPGPITKEEFTRQGILAANLLKDKTKIGAVYGELKLSDPDKVKDVLFSYNGRAHQYIKQSKDLGYSLPAEGSPYVMNLADDKRNSTKNPNWGQILTDNGPLGKANQKPGAWVQIEGLVKINKMAHDHTAAATQKTADAAPATPEVKEQFTGWTYPVPKGTPITSGFGPRGEGGKHDGEDFGANTGTPFYAAAGGVAKVIVVDVRQGGWCQAALAPLGMDVSQVADPIQKEVHITSVINGHTYETIYAHLSEVDVAPNQIVTPGMVIGKTGGSGCSTGPHAHFEVRRDGVPIDPDIILDPAKWQAQLAGDIKVASSDSRSLADGIPAINGASANSSSHESAQSTVDRAERAANAVRDVIEQAQRGELMSTH